jgi:uncharacterized protein (TIGR03437 family)
MPRLILQQDLPFQSRIISKLVWVLLLACASLPGQQYTISTIAGSGGSGTGTGDGGPAVVASLSRPKRVVADGKGNIFILDAGNNRIRKIDPTGVLTAFAGDGSVGIAAEDRVATRVALLLDLQGGLYFHGGLAVDSTGNVYFSEGAASRVRRVSPDGLIKTVAGTGSPGSGGDGGPATKAMLDHPEGLAVDAAGNLFIADTFNHCVRKVTPTGIITTVAGNPNAPLGDGGPATAAYLSLPQELAVDAGGNLFILDYSDNRVRKVAPSGIISTVAGNGKLGFSGDGGPATGASFAGMDGIAVDKAGNLFIADRQNNCIRMVSSDGKIARVAGTGTGGFSGDGGPATSALMNYPLGLAVDPLGRILVADWGNNRVRMLTPTVQLAVTNAASYSRTVAPGSIASAFGSFGPGASAVAASTPLPVSLGGVALQFTSSLAAPLFFVSANQVNFQVPWEAAFLSGPSLSSSLAGQSNSTAPVQISAFAPGVFTMNGQGTGQGAIVDSTYRLVNASNPATPGSTVLQIFCTGLGPVKNQPRSGYPAPSSPLAETIDTPIVTVGGAPAQVLFSGLAPGFIGEYQVNAVVPAAAPAGNDVPVVVSIVGVASNTVTIAVKSAPVGTGTLQIQVTSLPAGMPANVTVTSTAGYSATVTSSQSLQVPPGTYTVLANTVPGTNVYYAAFPPQQTVTVSKGSVTAATASYSAAILQTTKVLDQQGQQGLSVSPDGSTVKLPAGSTVGQTLAAGQVLAVGVTPATPNGLLRKIVSVSRSSSQVSAGTAPATLADAFQQANFTFKTTLTTQGSNSFQALVPGVEFSQARGLNFARQDATPLGSLQTACPSDTSLLVQMFDAPIAKDSLGTVSVSGEIRICPTLQFDWNIGGFPPSLRSLTATATFGEQVHITIAGSYQGSLDKQIAVGRIASEPITVFIGPVPVVLTPAITFFVGASGKVTAGISVGVTQSASVTGGISYADGKISPIFSRISSFEQDPLGIDTSLSAKAYAGVNLELSVYGIVSPQFSPDAFIQLDADLLANPWWKLTAGLEGYASVKVGIFGFPDLFDFTYPKLFEISQVIAQASGGFGNSVPVLEKITPDTATAGSAALTLSVKGSGFIPGATVVFDGAALTTTYVSTTQLTAMLPAIRMAIPGYLPVFVANPGSTGRYSERLTFVVRQATTPNPLPVITSLAPSSVTAGAAALTVVIRGTGFVPLSSITFNGKARAVTYLDAGQLTFDLTSAELSVPGAYPIIVTNPEPGGGISTPAAFTVVAPPALTLQSITLSSTSITGGVTVTGTITLGGPAGSGGVIVQLASNGTAAQVPATASIAQGQRSASFPISTASVGATQTVVITATLGSIVQSAGLTLLPAGQANPFLGRAFTIQGTATIDGQQVSIRTYLSFIGQSPFAALDNAMDAASPIVMSLSFNQAPAYNGYQVTFNGVDSVNSAYVNTSTGQLLPQKVTDGSLALTLDSPDAGSPFSGTLQFTVGSVSRKTVFTGTVATCTGCIVKGQGPVLQSLTINPGAATGGSKVSGTVTLSSPAPSAGVLVNLMSYSAAAQVPTTVSIPAGQTSATFTITTALVSSAENVVIIAELTTGVLGASLKVTPPAASNPFAGHSILVQGTVTIDGVTVHFNCSVIALPGVTPEAHFDNNYDGASNMMVMMVFGQQVAIGANSITFTGVNTGAIFDDFRTDPTGAKFQAITAGTLSLTANSSAVGGPVTGSLQFTAGGVTRQSAVNGTITLIK